MPPSPVLFSGIDVELPVKDVSGTSSWLHQVARDEDCFISKLHYHFCSDEHLLEMNREHLDHDYYTDIITFDTSRGPVLSGDAFISIERVQENALNLKTSPHLELMRVIVHGLLHLAGYSDKTEEERQEMREREKRALKRLH